MSIVHRMRWALTAVFALALALVASAPRRARAQAADIGALGGYITSSAYTGEDVLFGIQIGSSASGTESLTASIDFPAGVTYVGLDGSMSAPCTVSADESEATVVDVQFSIPGGAGCSVVVKVKFSIAGVYGAGDTTWFVDTTAANGADPQFVAPNITIIAVAPPSRSSASRRRTWPSRRSTLSSPPAAAPPSTSRCATSALMHRPCPVIC